MPVRRPTSIVLTILFLQSYCCFAFAQTQSISDNRSAGQKIRDTFTRDGDFSVCTSADGPKALAACIREEKRGYFTARDKALIRALSGTIKLNNKKYKDAADDFSGAIKLFNGEPDFFVWRGKAYEKLEDYESLIANHDAAISLHKQGDLYLERAKGFIKSQRSDRLQRALADLDEAIKVGLNGPDEAEAYYLRGAVKLYLDQPASSALNDIDRALGSDLAPNLEPRAHFYRGLILLGMGKVDESLKALNKSVEGEKRDDAHALRGEIYLAKGSYGAALADFNQAVKLGPSVSEHYRRRAETLRTRPGPARAKISDLRAAEADYNLAVRLDRNNAGAFKGRALLHWERREIKNAISDAEIAISLDSKDYAPYITGGKAYLEARMFERAQQLFEAAHRLGAPSDEVTPGLTAARVGLDAFRAAKLKPDEPVQVSPAPDPPVQKPPAQEPPAQEPPAQEPPTQEPPPRIATPPKAPDPSTTHKPPIEGITMSQAPTATSSWQLTRDRVRRFLRLGWGDFKLWITEKADQ